MRLAGEATPDLREHRLAAWSNRLNYGPETETKGGVLADGTAVRQSEMKSHGTIVVWAASSPR